MVCICTPFILTATNYYVAPWGDDAYDGMSWDSAFATLQYAADIVTAGDSVFAANGEYAGFDLRIGGSASLPIAFQGYGDSVHITSENAVTPDGINVENADWVVIDGFTISGITRAGIRIAVSQHVTIKNNRCENNGRWGIFTAFADYAIIENNECMYSQVEHGIYFSNSADHPIIRHNICHHNHANGIHMNGDVSMGGDGLITDAIVESNRIYENGFGGGSGINCDGVADSWIYNNLLYMNHASGISLYRIDGAAGSYSNRIYNNTIINAPDSRWCLNINNDSYGDTLYNNILINLHSWRGSVCIDASSLPGFQSDYNIVVNSMSDDGGNTRMTLAEWQALGYDLHSMLADSLDSVFVDWSTGDYHLRTGSQAIDNGTSSVSPIVQDDLEGIPRPQGAGYDMGSYEFVVGGSQGRAGRSLPISDYRVHHGSQTVTFRHTEKIQSIVIYDILGQHVHEVHAIGSHTYLWETHSHPSGIYFYSLVTSQPGKKTRGKIVLIK